MFIQKRYHNIEYKVCLYTNFLGELEYKELYKRLFISNTQCTFKLRLMNV